MKQQPTKSIICGLAFLSQQVFAIENNGDIDSANYVSSNDILSSEQHLLRALNENELTFQDIVNPIECGQTIAGDTNNGTNQYENPSNEHLYSFNLAFEANITLDTCDSSFDTYLRLYNSTGGLMIYNDDFDKPPDCGITSKIEQYTVKPGEYFAMVEGFHTFQGRYNLTLSCEPLAPLSSVPSLTPSVQPTKEPSLLPSGKPLPSSSLSESQRPKSQNLLDLAIIKGDIDCDESVSGNTQDGDSLVHLYNFTLEEEEKVRFNLCDSKFDTIVRIYDASTSEEVAFNDDSSKCGYQSLITEVLNSGKYFVMVYGFNGEGGYYTMAMTCGDDPVPMEKKGDISCGEVLEGDTSGLTNQVANTNPSGEDVYEFKISGVKTNVIFDTCQSEFDTFIAVYNDEGNRLFVNDDFCGIKSKLDIVIDPGTYYLLVEGYKDKEGQYTVSMSCNELSLSPSPTTSNKNMPSSHPSAKPSQKPTIKPSIQPTELRSLKPSVSPTESPSLSAPPTLPNSATPSNMPSMICIDPNVNFIYDTKVIDCSWLKRKNKISECKKIMISKTCPVLCANCDKYRCADSPLKFLIKLRGVEKLKSCRWVKKNKIKRCKKQGVDNFCRETCGFCIDTTSPSVVPTSMFSALPTGFPSQILSDFPSLIPSTFPSVYPTQLPSLAPSKNPTNVPSGFPSNIPSTMPSVHPSSIPSTLPSARPSEFPSKYISATPSLRPSWYPSSQPSQLPSVVPTLTPSKQPSLQPSSLPSQKPSKPPSPTPSLVPSESPSENPSFEPSEFIVTCKEPKDVIFEMKKPNGSSVERGCTWGES